MSQALETEAAQKVGVELLADEAKFIDLANSPLWLADEHEVLPD